MIEAECDVCVFCLVCTVCCVSWADVNVCDVDVFVLTEVQFDEL